MRKTETAIAAAGGPFEHPVGRWVRHIYTGWVCLACGYHAKWQAAADTHERRAMRDLGCYHEQAQPNTEAQGRR